MKISWLLATAVALALGVSGCFPHRLSEAELSDPGIRVRLEEQLHADRSLDLRYVTVDVHQRIVTISGLVSSWENRLQIERIARRIPGVEQVVVNLVTQE